MISDADIDRAKERLFARVQKTASCWLWVGCRDKHGYGQLSVNNKRYRAHRLSYEIANGPIPAGLDICHSCDNPSCVNPAHLWAGTASDNITDCYTKGRHPRVSRLHVEQRAETHCPKGHKFTDENTYWSKDGRRRCKECINEGQRRRYDPEARRKRWHAGSQA